MHVHGDPREGVRAQGDTLRQSLDSLAACGLLMGDIWEGKRIVTVDMLAPEFLETAKTGQTVRVHTDGMVEIKG